MANLDLNIAAEININLLELHSAYVEVAYWQDAAKTVEMQITGALKLTAKNAITGQVIEIAEGEGISKDDNKIIIDMPTDDNVFAKGTWNYDVRGDLDSGYSIPYIEGKIFSK